MLTGLVRFKKVECASVVSSFQWEKSYSIVGRTAKQTHARQSVDLSEALRRDLNARACNVQQKTLMFGIMTEYVYALGNLR